MNGSCEMKKVVMIVGPTATGKTGTAIELAKMINGEIISADSMQVYKHMDIGTAKPDTDEMMGIKHHLIDFIEPDESFSVAQFREFAIAKIKEISSRGKYPIVTGGTGLYASSLIYNINYSDTKTDWNLRNTLNVLAKEKGNEYLHNELEKIDPEAALKIHPNDIKRVIRAIEVYTQTQKTISFHKSVSRTAKPEFEYLLFGLEMERAQLYSRIDARVDAMFNNGLLDEVRKLFEKGYESSQGMQGLGYKEVMWYLKGETTLEETVKILKRNTRRYAKRQMTWFRKIENLDRIIAENPPDCKKMALYIFNVLQPSGQSSKI